MALENKTVAIRAPHVSFCCCDVALDNFATIATVCCCALLLLNKTNKIIFFLLDYYYNCIIIEYNNCFGMPD